MFTVQQAITSRLELDTVLQLISDEARRLTKSERTTVFLIEGGCFKISVISGNNDINMLGYRMPIKESLTSMALETGKPVRVNDAKNDPNSRSAS